MTVYLDYFGLRQAPFSITPDPGYVYLSRRHEDALAHLLYGIGRGGSGGFVQLTGEVGTGKTTLCRCLLEQIPENTHIALILNPMLSPLDLLQAICDELSIAYQRDFSSRELVNALNAFLLQAHSRDERVVLVIDEAQNLQSQALEQVRLLTNLETHTDKLLQIILLGQPELRELLASASLRQLSQRITARYHLQPLNETETMAYVKHRLSVAGRQQALFTRDGQRALYRLSGGVPRLINIYADRALMGAYARDAEKITGSIVRRACQEVGQLNTASQRRYLWPASATALLVVALAAFWWLRAAHDERLQTVDVSAAVTQTELAESASVAVVGDDASAGSSTAPAAQTATSLSAAADEATLAAWLQQAQPGGIWQRWAQLWGSSAEVLQAACADGSDPAAGKLDSPAGLESVAPASSRQREVAAEDGFFCTTMYGNWGRIRQLQLPVVVMLQDDGSAAVPVLVERLDATAAMLSNGVQSRLLAVEDISPLWQNAQFSAVCPGRSKAWTLGDDAGDIGRLKQQAAQLALQPFSGSMATAYDQEFADWVGRYQLRNGLQVDRVLGRDTRLFLCAEAKLASPSVLLTSQPQE